jgi:signal transduction histidine kinase
MAESPPKASPQSNRVFSLIPSVKATRLFDSKGKVVIPVPEDLPDAQISAADFAALASLNPVSHFLPAARAADLSMLPNARESKETFPLLEILVPLHAPGETRLLGAVQFLLDGTSIAEEFRALDYKLLFRAAAAFFAVGAILTFVLALAFHQLQRTNALLVQRTQSLLRANQELTLAAKTSAVGAVTAHLIHGLRNPLSGLQSFMAGRNNNPGEQAEMDWDVAVSTARRMQALINETVRVLREQDGTMEYELSLEEIAELISSKLSPIAHEHGVELRAQVSGDTQFNNRDANLIVLILENLINNAIQATPSGRTVALEIVQAKESVLCEVRDQGGGLPDHLKNSLFKPCQSTKAGGSGIGLAISKQLASSFGAELDLKSSTSAGCVFTLAIPIALCSTAPSVSAEQTCVS